MVGGYIRQDGRRLVFILGEFDRPSDPGVRRATADRIKTLSDNHPAITLIIVGVGQNISGLIGEHKSVERNLVQVEMPEMSADEIRDVVAGGFAQLGLSAPAEVLAAVVRLSDGFPHYAHLLGLSAARAANQMRTKTVDQKLFEEVACPMAVSDANDTFRQTFADATRTTNVSRYPQVLCACAFAESDERGLFKTGDVADAMRDVFGEDVRPHSSKGVLGRLAAADRGDVLTKVRIKNVNFYQFKEPMMKPFLRIKARELIAAD